MSGYGKNSLLYRKVLGCLYGGAIGDALGGPTEGKTPEAIRERYGEVLDFVEPWDGPSGIGKGDGRHTDDTHMVRVLCEIYRDAGDRIDVFDFAREIPGRLAADRWISEYGREAPLVDRLFHPEKWLYHRHGLANVDPRSGGVGNMVNCGACMYAAPVGMVNAFAAEMAYRDAIDIFSAHQVSFGLEAAGLMAFAVSAAISGPQTILQVYDATLAQAHEGTRHALAALRPVALAHADWRTALPLLRETIQPFDTAPDDFRDRGNRTDDWTPSRTHCIEELPIALALLLVCQGDFESAVVASANYGRDCDSIAGMAGAIAGSLHGVNALPTRWIQQVNAANRMNLDLLADEIMPVIQKVTENSLVQAQRLQDQLPHFLHTDL